jgi:chemotaxis protein MotA
MDILSLVGLFLAFAAILVGQHLEGGHIGSLLQLTAFMIVIGGTVGAVMLHTPMAIFLRALKMMPWVFMPPKLDAHSTIEKILNWSQVARKEGLLGLESTAETEPDPFAKKGVQLLVDGTEPEAIRKILEVEIGAKEHVDLSAAKMFESMGAYAPTIGIIGAVMGLIHVMENLSDPSKLGSGIAVAFVATIYGVGVANIMLIPIANKLKSHVQGQTQFREMIIEGLVSIAQGENPRAIESKLKGYAH